MKLIAVPLVMLFLVEASAQEVNIPPMDRDTLENGLTLILMRYDRVPVVHLRLMVRGGSAQDPADKPGVASLMAALMKEGTMSRSSSDIADEVDFTGGYVSTGAGLDYCAVTMEILSKDLDAGIDLFADVALNPSFPETELDRERKQRFADLEGMKEDPSAIASRVFTRHVYQDHPYGRQTGGTSASLAMITREDLAQFHQATFMPGNAVLVVVGDFDPVALKSSLAGVFGSWRPGETKQMLPGAPVSLTGRKVIVVDKPDATQTQIRIGNTGVPMNDPDRFTLLVANTIFGSGFTSRLIDELRVKRSLTYGASSGFPSSLAGGTYVISTFTRTETTAEIIKVILDQIALFRSHGPTAGEVGKAKNYIAGGFARGLQTPGTLATRITDGELYGFPPDYLQTYIEDVNGVRLDEMKRVIGERFLIDDALIVLVMPASARPAMLEEIGSVSVIGLDAAVE